MQIMVKLPLLQKHLYCRGALNASLNFLSSFLLLGTWATSLV